MPFLNLGPFGRYQITRADHEEDPLLPIVAPGRVQQSYGTLTLPPPYTSSTTLNVPPKERAPSVVFSPPVQASAPICRTDRISRFLTEIVALTFNVDFDELNSALYSCPIVAGTNTILTDQERSDLKTISDLVRKVIGQMKRYEINDIRSEDETTLRNLIMSPGDDLDLSLGAYALDLIGWYDTQAWSRYPPAWQDTIPGYWHEYRPHWQPDLMRTFMNVVAHASPNGKVQGLSSAAVRTSARRSGVEVARPLCIYVPMRDGYTGLRELIWDTYEPALANAHFCKWDRICRCNVRSLVA